MNSSINYRSIVWEFLYQEFYQNNTHDELILRIEDFISMTCKDEIYLAESEFGNNDTYIGTTKYIPSKNKIFKQIHAYDYDGTFEESIMFKSTEELQAYFYQSSFDTLLEPEIDEVVLNKHFMIDEGGKVS